MSDSNLQAYGHRGIHAGVIRKLSDSDLQAHRHLRSTQEWASRKLSDSDLQAHHGVYAVWQGKAMRFRPQGARAPRGPNRSEQADN